MLKLKSEPKAALQVASNTTRKPHIRLTPEVCLMLREISSLRASSYVAHARVETLLAQFRNLEKSLEDKLETVYHFCL